MIICRLYILLTPIFPSLNSAIYDFLRYGILKSLVTVRENGCSFVLYKFYLYTLNIYKIYIYIRFYSAGINLINNEKLWAFTNTNTNAKERMAIISRNESNIVEIIKRAIKN